MRIYIKRKHLIHPIRSSQKLQLCPS